MKYKLLKDIARYKTGHLFEYNHEQIYIFNEWIDPKLYPNDFEPVIERWRAGKGDYFFFINYDGISNSRDDYFVQDNELYISGNYFKTREQAEEASRRIKKVLMDYHKEIGE